MKRKPIFLKTKTALGKTKLFRMEESYHKGYVYLKDGKNGVHVNIDKVLQDVDSELIYNTDIAAGIAVIVILSGLAFWILNLIV